MTIFGIPLEILVLWGFVLWQSFQMNTLTNKIIEFAEQNLDLNERLKRLE